MISYFRRFYKYLKNHLFGLMLNEKNNKSSFNMLEMSSKDWVLSLLNAKKSPIKGKLMFVKLMFLLSREIREIDEILNFYPAKYGPYSTTLAQVLNKQIEKGIIEIRTVFENDYERTDFLLTAEGIRQADEVFSKLPKHIKDLLYHIREKGDNLGYSGIIRYVYSKYPEYAIVSDIAEEFGYGT